MHSLMWPVFAVSLEIRIKHFQAQYERSWSLRLMSLHTTEFRNFKIPRVHEQLIFKIQLEVKINLISIPVGKTYVWNKNNYKP